MAAPPTATTGDALQYLRWESQLEVAFWQQLAQEKLNSMRLSEAPVDVWGSYVPGRGIDSDVHRASHSVKMVMDSGSFRTTDHAQPAGAACSVLAPASLVVYNKFETFKAADKNAILGETVKEIWRDMHSGAIAEQPALLNRFVIIVHADLKTWKFFYWFCFPGLSMPSAVDAPATTVTHAAVPQLARDLFSAPEAQAAAASVTAAFGDATKLPSAFIMHTVAAAAAGATREFSAHPLSEHQEYFGAGKHQESSTFLCVVDPCTLAYSPGWVLRNLLCYVTSVWKISSVSVICYKVDAAGNIGHSLVLRLNLPHNAGGVPITVANCPKAIGWEMDGNGKPRPRLAKMGPVMDPKRLAESAVDLNLQLMRWRLMPELAVDRIARTKCLLLGAGTLGCQVARSLLGWGVRTMTFVDCGRVSFSNPVRQSLFEFEDCKGGGKPKAEAAAEAVRRIFPGVTVQSYDFAIPMPGHPVPDAAQQKTKEDVELLEHLIQSHDVIFLLTDTRESRWLPTLLAIENNKLALTVALGFDSYLVMRHGICNEPVVDQQHQMQPETEPEATSLATMAASPDKKGQMPHLGCYFCADVVAPADSMTDRTLDQQCTVTRPGLAAISGASAVELLVNLLHHPNGSSAAAACPDSVDPAGSPLGGVPHQIRGFLGTFGTLKLTGAAFDACTACSSKVRSEYRSRRFDFVNMALQSPTYLEDLTGLTELHAAADAFDDEDIEWDSE